MPYEVLEFLQYLRVDDVDSYHTELQGKGVKIMSALATKPWDRQEFGVATPEGHRLMIGQWIGE